MKNSSDTIEPITFRLVAQWLNQLRYGAPPIDKRIQQKCVVFWQYRNINYDFFCTVIHIHDFAKWSTRSSTLAVIMHCLY